MSGELKREAWLAERRKGIGSSDAANLLGLGFRPPIEIYMEKIGALSELAPTPAMIWGLRHEPAIAQAYAEATGQELSAPSLRRHPKHDWMLASIDRMTAAGRIVELKTASPFTADQWGEPATDQVPEGYLVQVQHQMAVADLEVADIAVLIGLSDFRIYTVQRSDQLIADLIELEWQFWQRVQERKPPDPDWGDRRTQEILQKIRPVAGEIIPIPEPEMAEVLDEYLALQQQEKAAGEAKDRLKAMMLGRLGFASEGILGDGRRVVRAVVSRRGYTVQPYEYVSFRVKER